MRHRQRFQETLKVIEVIDKKPDSISSEARSSRGGRRTTARLSFRGRLPAAILYLAGCSMSVAGVAAEPLRTLPMIAQSALSAPAESVRENASAADAKGASPIPQLSDQTVADIIYSVLVASVAGEDYPLYAWRIYMDVARLSNDPAAAKFAFDYARQAKDTEKSLQSVYRWSELSPEESEPSKALVHTLIMAERVDEAAVQLEKILQRFQGEGMPRGKSLKESLPILIEAESPDIASQVLMRHIEKYDGRRDHWALLALGTMLGHYQRPMEAIDALEQARAIYLASLDDESDRIAPEDDRQASSPDEGIALSAERSGAADEAITASADSNGASSEGTTASAERSGVPSEGDSASADQITVPLARLLHANGRSDDALSILEEFIERSPGRDDVRIIYGHTLFESGRRAESYAVFNDIVAKSPNNINARYALAILLLQSGQIDEAAEQFEFITVEGQTSEVYAALFYLARISEYRGDVDEAIDLYRRVRQGDNSFNAQVRVVELLAEHRDVGLARNHLRTIRPRSWQNMQDMIRVESRILVDAGLYEDALEVYNKAIGQFKGVSSLLYQRGILAIEYLDRLDIMEGDMRAILETEPDNVDALNTLGYSLADRTDRYEEAYELISRALRLAPDNHYILDSMGWVLYRMGQPERAVEYLRRALTKQPEAEIAAHLGEVLWSLNRKDEARNVLETALQTSPDDENLLDSLRRFGM